MASAFARMDETEPPFDVLHDHSGFTAFAFADRIDTPMVHTLHGPFTAATSAFYARHAHKAKAVALSRYQADQAPAALDVVAVIGNPIVVADFFPRREGRLPALDRPPRQRQGAAARDRRGARGWRSARARGAPVAEAYERVYELVARGTSSPIR